MASRSSAFPAGADVSHLLIDGEVDAMIFPRPGLSCWRRASGLPLFRGRQGEVLGYYRKHGDYPACIIGAFLPLSRIPANVP